MRFPPEDVAELKAFRPIGCLVIAVYCVGTLVRDYFFPAHLGLTTTEEYLLLAVEAAAILSAIDTHRDNVRKGVYQQ